MKWLGGLLLIAAFTLPAFAQVSVYIEPRRPRFVRNAAVRRPDPASSGSRATRLPTDATTAGCQVTGIIRPTRAATGTIRSMMVTFARWVASLT